MDNTNTREEIFIPAPPDKELPFKLHLAGISYCSGDYHIERNPCDLYVLEYIESGCGELKIGEELFHPHAHDVYLVPAWSHHHYRSDGKKPWIKYWFNVSGEMMASALEQFGLQGVHLFGECPAVVGECFKNGLRLLREQSSPEAVWRTAPGVVIGILHELAAHQAQIRRAAPPVSIEGRKVRLYLDQHLLTAPPALEELSRLIGRSNVQTIRIFRRDFGQTPIQYLLGRKIAAARELLRASSLTVKEIAAQLGFEDEYYFSRLFKRKSGLAPAHYRKRA